MTDVDPAIDLRPIGERSPALHGIVIDPSANTVPLVITADDFTLGGFGNVDGCLFGTGANAGDAPPWA